MRALRDAVSALTARVDRLEAQSGRLVVADTNVYLHHEQLFDEVDWPGVVSAGSQGVHLVVPLLVVDELDRHKRADRQKKVRRGAEETVGTRARRTLRALDELFEDPRWVATLRPDRGPPAPAVRAELLLDPPGHVRLPDADDELVDQAAALRDLSGRDVAVVTGDTGMALRARAVGLDVTRV